AQGGVAALYHARGRGEPEAAAYRLDRSLPAASPGPADADRGNPARARRTGAAGKGALLRLLESDGTAGRRSAGHGTAAWAWRVPVMSGRVLPARARGRAWDHSQGQSTRLGGNS